MIRKVIKKIGYELQFNNTSYYKRISDNVLKRHYKKLLIKKVDSLSPILFNTQKAALTLAILANKKNFYESVAALYSFCFWERDIQVHYHEDGTLTEKEIGILKKIFPLITVFTQKDENIKVDNYLKDRGLNKCADLRGHFIFSIRLFDMIIEKQTSYLLQIDSDVLFFSNPAEILNVVKQNKLNGCYNVDTPGATYTYRDDIIAKHLNKPMVLQLNAGVFMHNFDEGLFDFCETILKNEPEGANSWHLEQTLFAMYASRKGNFLALPKTYDLAKKERNAGNAIISEHYVHNTGYDFHKDFIYKIYPGLNNL